jgi:hypothetical protein
MSLQRIWFGLIVFIFPASCSSSYPTVTSTTRSLILSPAQTKTPAPAFTPTSTPTFIPSPTFTTTPTQTLIPTSTRKPYLIKYGTGANDGSDEVRVCILGTNFPQFILYDDGQLILWQMGRLVETKLTEIEIKDLLTRIDQTGYFQVDTSQSGSPGRDGTYIFPEGFELSGGWFWTQSIEIKGKEVTVEERYYQYIVKPITEAISIVSKYIPKEETKPYIPVELRLIIFDFNYDNVRQDFSMYLTQPTNTFSEWPSQLPVLHIGIGETTLDVHDIATLVNMRIFTEFPSAKLFDQDSNEYFVAACPVLDN